MLKLDEYNLIDLLSIGSNANNSIATLIMANTWGTEGSLETSKTDAKIAAFKEIGAEYLLDSPLT